MKHLCLGTPVWGKKHVEWFKRTALPSLAWPKNKVALEGATWTFLTQEENREEIHKAVLASGIKIGPIEFACFGDLLEKNPHASGALIKEWLMQEGSKSLSYDRQYMVTPPDTIFGDGTVNTLREVAQARDVVVLVAHMRANTSIMDDMGTEPLSNAKLVSLAMKHKHKTWEESEVGLPKSNSYIGGVSWRYLEENLFAVTHRLPTPYMINFTPEDLVYFKNQIHWGVIDHHWPTACLITEERQRLIGSSDAAFMVEVTEPDQNIPPVEWTREDTPDAFWKNNLHNKVNRLSTIIFRGE